MDEVKRGELYYADLSPVVGSEQGGIRPVLILQNDKTNQNSTTTIVAAMTSQIKNNLQTHVLHQPNFVYCSDLFQKNKGFFF